MMNIRSIANEAGVSIATVSRALDPKKAYLVHPETRQHIEKIVARRNYIPNMAARALNRKSSNTLGVVTILSADLVQSPYFTRLIAGIIDGASLLDYDLKLIMVKPKECNTCCFNELRRRYLVDGLIFLNWRRFPKFVREVERAGNFPAVLINDYTPQVRTNIVYCNNRAGVAQLIEYAKEKKYTSVGILKSSAPDFDLRYKVFKYLADKNKINLKRNNILHSRSYTPITGYEMAKKWCAKTKKLPRLLFALDDELAWGAIKALQEAKLRVPCDIAVVGFDGAPSYYQDIHLLTTIVQPLEEMGRTAVSILGNWLRSKKKKIVQKSFLPSLYRGKTA
jgi:DNA-binding LacI/PurR family transcriptional regulator